MNQSFHSGYGPPVAEADLAATLRRAWRGVLRQIWFLAAVAIAAGAGGYAAQTRQDAFYQAGASLIIDPRAADGSGSSQAPTIFLADALVVDSEIEILKSDDILHRVIDALGIVGEIRARRTARGEEPGSDAALRDDALASLARRIEVSRIDKTFVIRITATAAEPVRAAEIANAVAETYLAAQIEHRLSRVGQVGAFLAGQLDRASAEVIAAETRIEEFLYAANLPDDDSLTATEQELSATETELIAARKRIGDAAAQIETIAQLQRDAPARAEITQADLEARNQLIRALGGQESMRSGQIAEELQRLRDLRAARIRIAQAEIAGLESRIADLRERQSEVGAKRVQLRKLQREAAALQAQYEALLARSEQTQRADQLVLSSARIIERAVAPATAGNRPAAAVASSTALAGLLVALALVFLRAEFDDRLRSSEDVTRRLGLPYYGPVLRLPRRRSKGAPVPPGLRLDHLPPDARAPVAELVYGAMRPFSEIAETYRRVSADLARRDESTAIVVAVASALAAEGKTVFAGNLAFFLSLQGKRVLLVDADFRNPGLTRRLAPVLSVPDVIAGVAQAPPWPLKLGRVTDTLSLLCRDGPDRINMVEQHMRSLDRLLALYRDSFDVIVVDTAPLGHVSDTLAVADSADRVILIIRWGRTAAHIVQKMLRLNAGMARKVAGVCLSRVSPRRLRRHEDPAGDYHYFSSAVNRDPPVLVLDNPVAQGAPAEWPFSSARPR